MLGTEAAGWDGLGGGGAVRPSWIRFVMDGLAEAGWTTWEAQSDVLVWLAPLPEVVQAA